MFEGEFSFLSGIMELSDELYAAAASLGIELQLFCSYSSELTDEIILNCVGHATKLIRGLYPKMLESETLGESFLTKIPSVNPLSAHAILSSVGMLVEFFEWSHRHRVHALQRYPIPNESINLLSAFCRYGEREDSKSSMTDCSSSVSSAPDSSNCCGKSESEKRERTCPGNPDRTAMPEDELFQIEGSKQCSEYRLNPPRTFKPYTSWISKDLEISEELGKSPIAFDDRLFGNKCGTDTSMMTNPARLSNSCDFEMSNVLEISPKKENPSFSANHLLVGQRKGLHMPMMNGLDWPSNNNRGSLQKKFIGEVVDIDDCFKAGKVSETAASISFSPLATKMGEENAPGTFLTARNSSRAHSHPTFPSAAEISLGSASWSSERDSGQNPRERIHDHPDMDFNNSNMPLKHQNMFLQKGVMLNSAANFMKPSFQEDISHYRKTPLSKAVLSGQAQEGSPWTIEFLNRIREKSRLRQKSLPRDLSGPCFGYSGNIAKAAKRKSPSILEFYKYQRGSPVLQSVERKRQKQPVQPSSSSKIEKGLPSSLQTRTPADKRAKRVNFSYSYIII